MKSSPKPSLAEARIVIERLLLELAAELDLHYDDEDLPALKQSCNVLEEGAEFLAKAGHSAHPDVISVIRRFHRQRQ